MLKIKILNFSDNHVADLELRALSPISSTRNDALVEAMHHILTKCATRDDDHDDFVTSGDVIVALPGTRSHFQGFPGKYKTDGATETLTIFRFPGSESSSSSSQNLRKFLDHHAPFFTGKGNSAVVAFLYSAILTRGIEAIKGSWKNYAWSMLQQKITITGSGCGSVGREVASNSRSPRIESSRRLKIISNINCRLYWKDENKEKEVAKECRSLWRSVGVIFIVIICKNHNHSIPSANSNLSQRLLCCWTLRKVCN